MRIIVDLANDSTGRISYPDIGVSRMPIAQVSFAFPDLTLTVNDGSGQVQKFEGKIDGDKIGGTWHGFGMQVPFFLNRTTPEPIAYEEESVTILNGDIALSGTLFRPKNDPARLAVIIIHGSGSQIRDLYRFYAEMFASNGIAAVIYDKRGSGASTGDWRKANFNDLANDAVAVANHLKNQRGITRVGFMGFSQGGWIAPLAATRFSDAAFVINVSGPAVTPREQELVLIEQLLPSFNVPAEIVKEVKGFIEQRTVFEKSGRGWNSYKKSREALEQKGVLNFIGAPDSQDSWLWDFYRRVFDYDPLPTLERLKCPVLVVYGELDPLTPVEKSVKLTEAKFKQVKKADYSVKVFKLANHGISYEPGKGGYQGFPRFATGYTELLVTWPIEATAVGQTPLDQLTTVAKRVVARINSDDYEGLEGEFNEQMQKALPLQKAGEFFKGLTAKFGKIQRLETGRFVPPNRAVFAVHFERGVQDMTLVLDGAGKVAGLGFVPQTSSAPVPEKNATALSLPFRGHWLVSQGGDSQELNSHHEVPNQRFAFDLVAVGGDGKTHRGEGRANEDHYVFGREILAPADGVVTDVIEGVRDNVPGSLNPYSALGNAIFIQHSENEVSVLAHLKQGSIQVKVGERVKRGQMVGRCGNSGNSSKPHLHYHLQNTPIIQDGVGIKVYFEQVVVTRNGRTETKQSYSPIKGDIISQE
jgi:murein DD-endopeptidase MepM/ murein hydrolase activator NlpD/alpha-beta hydrolase superfamily lysophospholipase